MSVDTSTGPPALLPALCAAVPMWINQLRGTDDWQRVALAKEDAQRIAAHGDALMFHSPRGEAARSFSALARGIAIAAYQPGGVTVFGHHWCVGSGHMGVPHRIGPCEEECERERRRERPVTTAQEPCADDGAGDDGPF